MDTLPTSRRPLSLGEILAWGVIVASIGIIFELSVVVQLMVPVDKTNESRSGADLPMLTEGRYAVGANAAEHDPETRKMLEKGIQKSATTSWDKLRAAIVEGELSAVSGVAAGH